VFHAEFFDSFAWTEPQSDIGHRGKKMRSLSRVMADMDLKWPPFSWTERFCSYWNPADLPSRDRVQEALEKYHLENGRIIEAPTELVQLVIQMHQCTYNAAHTEGGISLSTIPL